MTRNLFIVFLIVLFVQIIAIAYAMSLTLFSTSTEDKDTFEILMADFDNDGDLDYVAGNNDVTDTFKFDNYVNNGSASFSTSTFSTSTSFQSGVATDIDGDGDVDIVSANGATLYKYTNNGSGVFTKSTIASGVSPVISYIITADFDGDGDMDFVGAQTGSPMTSAIYLNNSHGVFTPAASTFPSIADFCAADLNSDGTIDIALNRGDDTMRAYKNSGTGAFVQLSSTARASMSVPVACGDIDGDGDIDVVGMDISNIVPFMNNGAGTFSVGTTSASNLSNTRDADLADLDNDGDLDVIISGDSSLGNGGGEIFINNGSGVFTSQGIPPNTVDGTKSSSIGDLDSDGDLDYIRGNFDATGAGGGEQNRIYLNDQAATSANTSPSAPSANFSAVKISDNGTVATVRLSWGSGSDTQTSTRLLQYQLKLGTGSTMHNIVSGKTAAPNWVSRVVPNGQSRTYLLSNLICRTGLTYYWSVSAVDTGFKSTASSEQTFTLDSSCNISSGGGGGGGSSGGSGVGGGLSARYFYLNNPVAPKPRFILGHITVTGYKDYDGNDARDFREPTGFTGLAFTASGRTIEDNPVHVTQMLNDQGQTTFDLPPSNNNGYTIMTDTGSEFLQEYVPTGTLPSGGHVLAAAQEKTLDIGFRRATLLAYKPCLTIGMSPENETEGTDARILVGRLEDAFGRKVVSGVAMNSHLMTRRDFLKLLAKTQCVPVIQNLQDSEIEIRQNAKKLKVTLPLVDLPLDLTKPDSQLVYSLLTAGADITRSTLIGDFADLSSPMTRREVVKAIRTVLPISSERVTDSGVLPKDLEVTDALVPDFFILQSLGILPESFLPIFGPSQGIDSDETALVIVRAAFRGGRISLIPASSFSDIQAPSRSTFLSVLPPVLSRACLETVPVRSTNIRYIDVFPGDTLFDDLHALLSRGTKNTAQKMLWLLTGTRRPTEFGIQQGQSLSEFTEPVSLIETLRSLLVLACVPPPTAGDVFSGKANGVLQGSGNTRAQDLISGLPRNASFLSRLMYRAQDHQTEFDQSLFTYYPEFLRQNIRSPMSGLSVAEASNILASGLLMSEVKAESLLPTDAENRFKELAAAIRKDLLGTDVHWRDAPVVDSIPFTKGMLLQFLSTVVTGRTSVPITPTSSRLPLGELWWSRIK